MSIEKGGKDFINAKEVRRLMVKLMYEIRADVFMKLRRFSEEG